ncbi:molybdopterin-dependent oxidoreductase [Loktanella salsilacus]|uniref:molybdopterin-dependent oxidoreductase n=1 Tax=Loktanella salsilacus TaxID=195913 RepID=UPI003704C0F7
MLATPYNLTREQLAALDMTSFETTTIWSDGIQTYEGTSLAALAELLGLTEGKILATAINDYTVEIPVSDAVEGGPIIAVLMNGEEMSVRDKGPLWIVYPLRFEQGLSL